MNYKELVRDIGFMDTERRSLLDCIRSLIMNEYPKYITLSMGEKNKLNNDIKHLIEKYKNLTREKKETIEELEKITSVSNLELIEYLEPRLKGLGYRITELNEGYHDKIDTHYRYASGEYMYDELETFDYGYFILSPDRFQECVELKGCYSNLTEHKTGRIKPQYKVDPVVYELLDRKSVV